MLTPLCSKCKYYLKIDLKAQEWEKTKLRCKTETAYCFHDTLTGNLSFYCEKQESIIKNSANGGICVPSFDMITTGLCEKHKEKECYFKRNCWGDEYCDNEEKEEPKTSNNPLISNLTELDQYLTANNIRSVERVRGKLLIEFNEQQARQEQPPK